MANKVALIVEILADASGLSKGMDQATGKVSGFESTLNKLTPAASIAVAGLALVGKEAVDSASRVEQSMGALDSVFGDNSATVKKWAADAAQSVGLAEAEYAELATVAGAQLQNLGLSQDQAMAGTDAMIALGADLAATFGGSTTEAVDALSGALRGEADSAEKYGLSLNATAVNAKLAEDGMSDLTGAELSAAKANAVLELATEQAGGAIGAFSKESDTLAGQQARTAAETENMKAALGEKLLPIMTTVTAALGDMATFVTENSTVFLVLAGVVAGLAVAVLAANVAMKIYRATVVAVTVVQKAWTIATKATAVAMKLLKANPIILIITAIVAVVAAVIHLWNTSEAFRNAVMAIWEAIKTGAEACWNAIKAVIEAVVTWATGFIEGFMAVVTAVWDTIKAVAEVVWNAILAVIEFVINLVTAYINAYLAVVTFVWNTIKAVATTVWNAIKAVINFVIDVITAYIRGFLAVATNVWNGIKSAAEWAWNGIKGIISGVIESVKGIIETLGGFVEGVWNSIKSATSRIWNGITDAIESALKPVKAIINGIEDAFQNVVDVVQNLINWIKKIQIPDLSALNPFKSAPKTAVATVPGPALGGRLAASPAATTTSSGGGIVVNVNGALDPVAVARQIRAILRDDDRRRQGVRLIGRTAT